jgi:hypothetical protein
LTSAVRVRVAGCGLRVRSVLGAEGLDVEDRPSYLLRNGRGRKGRYVTVVDVYGREEACTCTCVRRVSIEDPGGKVAHTAVRGVRRCMVSRARFGIGSGGRPVPNDSSQT